MKKIKTHYKNRLPHIAPVGATFFVTFRLADSLPKYVVEELREELKACSRQLLEEKPIGYKEKIIRARKKNFAKYDNLLDKERWGKCHLKKVEIAQVMKDKLMQYDGDKYDLVAYCIMPNHVHILIDTSIQITDPDGFINDEIPENYTQLCEIMKLIKGGSSNAINKILGTTGHKLWQKDSYDHFVRSEKEFVNILNYIILNPVKARMVNDWKSFPYSFVNSRVMEV